jgi:hypothetical protein
VKSQRMTLPIQDLNSNDGSIPLVEQTLIQEVGVRHVYVNPVMEMAYIEYDPVITSLDQLVTAVKRAGFHTGKPSRR